VEAGPQPASLVARWLVVYFVKLKGEEAGGGHDGRVDRGAPARSAIGCVGAPLAARDRSMGPGDVLGTVVSASSHWLRKVVRGLDSHTAARHRRRHFYAQSVVEGYETERERERRLAREQLESARVGELARRETFAAVRRELADAFERLGATPPNCMIEVMGRRVWSREPFVRRRVPGWFIGSFPYRLARGGTEVRVTFAIGKDGRFYLGRHGVGERREFRTTVPEFRFESLDQLAVEVLNELLEWLRAAGRRSTEA
jgi:hypothetical protein